MKDITTALVQQFRREHKAARRYMALLLALALLTSLFVNWQLHSVGIAQTADYQCGEIEHQHTAECYEKVLVCGLEEGELVEEPNPDYVPVDEEAFAVFDDAVALQPVVDDSSLDTPVHSSKRKAS